MNCNMHPDREAVGTCTSCGKFICSDCAVEVQGKLVCRECLSAGRASVAPLSSVPRPLKDRSIALVLEILPGLFGFLGFGWMYSGNVTVGILFLIGFFGWSVVAAIIDIFTAGIGLLCTVPLGLLAIAFSAITLNSYTKQHHELFGT